MPGSIPGLWLKQAEKSAAAVQDSSQFYCRLRAFTARAAPHPYSPAQRLALQAQVVTCMAAVPGGQGDDGRGAHRHRSVLVEKLPRKAGMLAQRGSVC